MCYIHHISRIQCATESVYSTPESYRKLREASLKCVHSSESTLQIFNYQNVDSLLEGTGQFPGLARNFWTICLNSLYGMFPKPKCTVFE